MVGLIATVHTNRRQIPADHFFLDLFESALDDSEIFTKISFPHAERAGYTKFPSPASRYAIVGVFIAVTGSSARVAITGAGSYIFRQRNMEQALAAAM